MRCYTSWGWMTPTLVRLGIGLFGVGLIAASAQPPALKGSPGNPLTVCEILKEPLKWDGQVVTVRDHTQGTDEGAWLAGKECRGIFVTNGHVVWPSMIALGTPSLPGNLHSPDFTYDVDSERRVSAKGEELAKSVPWSCLVSTYTGLFETRRDWAAARVTYPNGTSKVRGFGHLGAAPAQSLLRSADDIEVDPHCRSRKTGK